MSIAIDVVLVLIVAYAAWRGCKNGFIRSIFGILAIIIAIYGANLIAKTYSGEFSGVLEPVVSGIVDKAMLNARDEESSGAEDEANQDGAVLDGTTSVYNVSYNTLRNIGISEDVARQIAENADAKIDGVGQQMSAYLTTKLSETLAYIIVFGIAFIIIAIVFSVIVNISKLAYAIPGIKLADKLIGLILGILKGLLIVLVLAIIARYIGLISAETIDQTTVLRYILKVNPLADMLGI